MHSRLTLKLNAGFIKRPELINRCIYLDRIYECSKLSQSLFNSNFRQKYFEFYGAHDAYPSYATRESNKRIDCQVIISYFYSSSGYEHLRDQTELS